MADSGAEDPTARHDSDSEERQPKRKKVTWADTGAPRSLPAVPEAGAVVAATAPEPAVVVLPCDGLYDALTADLLEDQVDAPPPSAEGEPLTQRQLLQRRLQHTEQLASLYESELWGLLEELRLRHQQFTAVPDASVWKVAAAGDGDSLAEAEAGASPTEGSTGLKCRVAGAAAAGGKPDTAAAAVAAAGAGRAGAGAGARAAAAAAGAAAAGSSLKAVWEHQWGAAAGAQPPAQLPAAVAGVAAKARDGDAPAASKEAQQQNGSAVKGTALERQQRAQPPRPTAIPHFDEVEALVLGGAAAAAGCPPVDQAALLAQRQTFVRHLNLIGRLEQSALGATCRQLDTLGGLAVLCGRRRRFVVRRAAVAIGRCTLSQGKVDVDLSLEAPEGCSAQQVSRQQAQLYLEPDGAFRLRCTGRRAMLVNGRPLSRGQTTVLPSLSHIQAGNASLLFIANSAAAARAVHRSSQPTV